MKFQEIINKVDWLNVRSVLYDYYYKEHDNSENELLGYENVLNDLKKLIPQDCKKMRLYVEYVKYNKDETNVIEVIGRNGTLNKDAEDFHFFESVSEEIANSEITYALEMIRWEEWLDMSVPFEVIKNFSMPEIVAHALYEMTFLGFNQDKIQDEKSELDKRVEEVQEYLKDPEKNKDKFKILDLDEFKKELEDFKDEDLEDEDFEGM